MNHIPDTGKMVETPRTDAVIEICRDGSNEMHGEWVSSDFARQLERELDRCNNLYRKLDVHSLNLSDLIRKLERELQEAQERIRLLIAERDSARQRADQSWKLREEFTALLGTDDVKEAVRRLQLMNEKQISTTQTK
jgi:predicted  nucleic acid-binding Zn-ribbon protein